MQARSFWIIPVLLALSGVPGAASFDSPAVVNPSTNRSPSGNFVCEVDPSDIYGRGESTYRLLQNGAVVWNGKKPFTLVRAAVTDDGNIAGFGYSNGENGWPQEHSKTAQGDFVVAIIDTQGALRLHEVIARENSRFLHDLPNPLARGVIVDGPGNRFIVRVRDPDINRAKEWWWLYELSSGKKLVRAELTAGDGGSATPVRALPVAATPLILVHYWRYDSPDCSARFALLDSSLREVWSTTWRRDYNVGGDEDAEDRLREEIWSTGAILDTSVSNHFDLFSAKSSERVTFTVNLGPASARKWVVKEIGRKQHSPQKLEAEKLPAFRREALKPLGTFSIQEATTAEEEVFGNLIGFCFDDRGQIGVLRNGRHQAYSVALLDPDGRKLRETSLTKALPGTNTLQVKFTWVEGDRWVVTASEYGVGGKSVAWWLDASSGKLDQVRGFACPFVERLVGSGDGGFLALVVHRQKYSMQDELIAFDKRGMPVWWVKQDYQDARGLFSPEDVAVTSDGLVVVLDKIKDRLQYFDLKGNYRKTVALEKAWGRKPNYPTGISSDRSGGVLVRDFDGRPPFVRMGADGQLVSQFQAKHEDGRTVDPSHGGRVSPSGRLWVCDGSSLMRLTDEGMADLTLGPASGGTALGRVSAIAVNQQGCLFAVDERSGAVHVYDQRGRRLRVCTPGVTDFSGHLILADIGVTESGEVFLGGGVGSASASRHIHFAADGLRLGEKRLGLDSISERWYPLPLSDCMLALGYQNAFIVTREGKTLRTIQRRPDGNWLENPDSASIAPDGSFAILSRSRRSGARFFVNVFSPEGEPLRTFPLAQYCKDHCLAFTGKYLVTCTDTDICVLSATGEPLLSFPLPKEESKDPWWEAFSTESGRELWLVSRPLKKVHRFEMP